MVSESGPLMSAFESYAEKKNDLIEYITDQLNNGVYKTTVKTIETVDPITGEKKTVKIASLIPDDEISEDNIIAPALDKRVAQVVADAVIKTAKETGVARI